MNSRDACFGSKQKNRRNRDFLWSLNLSPDHRDSFRNTVICYTRVIRGAPWIIYKGNFLKEGSLVRCSPWHLDRKWLPVLGRAAFAGRNRCSLKPQPLAVRRGKLWLSLWSSTCLITVFAGAHAMTLDKVNFQFCFYREKISLARSVLNSKMESTK